LVLKSKRLKKLKSRESLTDLLSSTRLDLFVPVLTAFWLLLLRTRRRSRWSSKEHLLKMKRLFR
jgi:hypothetical protein